MPNIKAYKDLVQTIMAIRMHTYVALTDSDVQVAETMSAVVKTMENLFDQCENKLEEIPLHLNVLGYFLQMKYITFRCCMKYVAYTYPVPIYRLSQEYASLLIDFDAFLQIPHIQKHLDEILHIMQYAIDPKPLLPQDPNDLYWVTRKLLSLNRNGSST